MNIDLTGVCTRFAVLRRADGQPIEGTLYSHRNKANKRHGGSADPSGHYVDEVVVVPMAVMRALIARLETVEAS